MSHEWVLCNKESDCDSRVRHGGEWSEHAHEGRHKPDNKERVLGQARECGHHIHSHMRVEQTQEKCAESGKDLDKKVPKQSNVRRVYMDHCKGWEGKGKKNHVKIS